MPDPLDFRTSSGDGYLEAPDGTSLFCRWRRAEPSAARIFIAHGAAEHSGRYGYLIDFLHAHGYSVFAADHRGMGQSAGLPGDIESFDVYAADLAQFITLVETALGPKTTFILGHSMGTIVAARYASRHESSLRGLILMAMPLALKTRPPVLIQRLGQLLSKVTPGLKVSIGIKSEQLSSDSAVIAAADRDPLIDRHATLRWGTKMLDASDKMASLVKSLTLPILILHGEQDTISESVGTQAIRDTLDNQQSKIVLFQELRHELHNETEAGRREVFQTLLDWLAQVEEKSRSG